MDGVERRKECEAAGRALIRGVGEVKLGEAQAESGWGNVSLI